MILLLCHPTLRALAARSRARARVFFPSTNSRLEARCPYNQYNTYPDRLRRQGARILSVMFLVHSPFVFAHTVGHAIFAVCTFRDSGPLYPTPVLPSVLPHRLISYAAIVTSRYSSWSCDGSRSSRHEKTFILPICMSIDAWMLNADVWTTTSETDNIREQSAERAGTNRNRNTTRDPPKPHAHPKTNRRRIPRRIPRRQGPFNLPAPTAPIISSAGGGAESQSGI